MCTDTRIASIPPGGWERKRNEEVMRLLGKLSPDHKTIVLFRQENTTALKKVFRDFAGLYVKSELYVKELVATDGNRFKAVNSRDRIKEHLKELEENDGKENAGCGEKSTKEIGTVMFLRMFFML